MEKVIVTDAGILGQNQQRALTYLDLLDADRMLFNFRKTFGQDTKGAKQLYGWEEPDGLLRGHSTGHFLSGLALAYFHTRKTKYSDKAAYIVAELRKLQLLSKGNASDFRTTGTPEHTEQSLWNTNPNTWGDGFISAYSPDQFALLEQFVPYNKIWAPYYTLHKLLAGLLDVYDYCRNETAIDCAKGIADWVKNRLACTTEEQRNKMWRMYIAGEYGGINESFALLAKYTGDLSYLDVAKLFDNTNLLPELVAGQDVISGLHANQHIPQLIGAFRQWQAGGEASYYQAAKNFWHIVTEHYTYAIGGVGRGECFKEPDKLAVNIEADRNCETCATYNMLKLTALLYQNEPDSSYYMDYYERALLNHIAASQAPFVSEKQHNGVTYMLPIGPGAKKSYSNDYEEFTCCHGTGMENHVKYNQNIFFRTDKTLYVNLYIGADYYLDGSRILSMETEFPSEKAIIHIFENYDGVLKLRVPCWCRDDFSICVMRDENCFVLKANGETYIELIDGVKLGDIIEIQMPFHFELCKTKDKLKDHGVTAITYGPIVLVAKDERREWLSFDFSDGWECKFRPLMGKKYQFMYQGSNFLPMFLAHNISYHTYFLIDNEG